MLFDTEVLFVSSSALLSRLDGTALREYLQFCLYFAGGHCGSSPLRALPICWHRLQTPHSTARCVMISVGPVLYFPELHGHSDARRHSGKQSAPTRDWGRWDTLRLRGGGEIPPQPTPPQLTRRRRTRATSRLGSDSSRLECKHRSGISCMVSHSAACIS